MKKILILICLFANIGVSTYAANWQWVNSNSIYSKYIDTDSIQYDQNDTVVSSAIVWGKLKRIDSPITEYVQLKLDFQNQTIEPLHAKYDNADGVTVSTTVGDKMPAVPFTANIYGDYYYYIKGKVEHSTALKDALELTANPVYVVSSKDINGKVTVYLFDKTSIRKSDDFLSGYMFRIGLSPDNKPQDWVIQKVVINTKTQTFISNSDAWYIDEKNNLRLGIMDGGIDTIYPDSIGEKIYKFLSTYCAEHSEEVAKYTYGIRKAK